MGQRYRHQLPINSARAAAQRKRREMAHHSIHHWLRDVKVREIPHLTMEKEENETLTSLVLQLVRSSSHPFPTPYCRVARRHAAQRAQRYLL